MTQILRLVRQTRWDIREGHDWLSPGDIPAAPLADFTNTSRHSLSVWLVESEESVSRVVGALAASRERIDVLDYVLFPQDYLKAAELELNEVPGNTPDHGVNRFHRDLIQVSADKVVLLTKRIWHGNIEDGRNAKVRRAYAKDITQLVVEAVQCGRISLEKLKPKLKAVVRNCLGDEGTTHGRPR